MGGLMLPGDAQPGDVRHGKTASAGANYDFTGTLADNGSPSAVNPSTSTQTLAAGIYDSAITVNPVQGNATTADVLPSVTFSSQNGVNQTGTMATVTGGNTITPSTANQTAIAGSTYAENAITVAGSANLTAGNIAHGVDIFNVTGTLKTYAIGTANAVYNGSSLPTWTISGLSFTPSDLYVLYSDSSTVAYGDATHGMTTLTTGGNPGTTTCSLSTSSGSATLTYETSTSLFSTSVAATLIAVQ